MSIGFTLRHAQNQCRPVYCWGDLSEGGQTLNQHGVNVTENMTHTKSKGFTTRIDYRTDNLEFCFSIRCEASHGGTLL